MAQIIPATVPPQATSGEKALFKILATLPDDVYEATIAKLVEPGCAWIDIGCGRDIFPGNYGLAKELAERLVKILQSYSSESINSILAVSI